MNKLCAKLFKCFTSRHHPVVPDSPHKPQTLLQDPSLEADSKLNDGSKVRHRYKPRSKAEVKPTTIDYEMSNQAEIRQQTLMCEKQAMNSSIISSFDILESERSISLTI